MLTADIQLDHQRQGTARTSKLGNIKEFSLFVSEFPQLMINIDKTLINLQFWRLGLLKQAEAFIQFIQYCTESYKIKSLLLYRKL